MRSRRESALRIMSWHEHVLEAERLLAEAQGTGLAVTKELRLAEAQVHVGLAQLKRGSG